MQLINNIARGIAVSAFTMSAGAIPVVVNFENVSSFGSNLVGTHPDQNVIFSNFFGIESIAAPNVNSIITGTNGSTRAIQTIFGQSPITTVTFDPGSTFTSEFSFTYASNQDLFFTANYTDASSIAQSFSAKLGATFAPNIGPSQTDPDSGLNGCGQSGALGFGGFIFCQWNTINSADLTNDLMQTIPITGSLTSLIFSHSLSNDTPPGAALDNFTFNNAMAVPEPSTYALMALGLLGIGFAARRRMT